MYREITIGEKVFPMKATGATPIRYKHIFHQDLLTEFASVENNYAIAIDTISKLAFIMAKSADDGVDMTKLNEDKYVEWLEDFEPFDITNSADEIIDLYLGNTKSDSEVKKKVRDGVKES